jgi:hypothetical protein
MKIQWFWIGRPLINMGNLILYGQGEKDSDRTTEILRRILRGRAGSKESRTEPGRFWKTLRVGSPARWLDCLRIRFGGTYFGRKSINRIVTNPL